MVKVAWKNVAHDEMVPYEPVNIGDLLWRPNVGWAFGLGPSQYPDRVVVRLRGSDTEVKKGFYLNVSLLQERNFSLSDLIHSVDRAVSSIHAGVFKGASSPSLQNTIKRHN